MAEEIFEVELYGGSVERRYRKQRPYVDAMPWGTLDPSRYDEETVLAARRAWTLAAFQEHRAALVAAAAARAAIEVRAPLDLCAMVARFPVEELVHVELCARMTKELGGAVPLIYRPDTLYQEAPAELPPLLRAADFVVRFACVGEVVSFALARGVHRAARHPLAKAVLRRIAKDEAGHAAFGLLFLDWALERIDASEHTHLERAAELTIDAIIESSLSLVRRPRVAPSEVHALGWMETEEALDITLRTLEHRVRPSLAARGIKVASRGPDGQRR